jgi:hypothetical protein
VVLALQVWRLFLTLRIGWVPKSKPPTPKHDEDDWPARRRRRAGFSPNEED